MNVLRLLFIMALHGLFLIEVSPFGEWTRPQWALWALFMLPPQWGPFPKLLAGFGLGLGLDLMLGTYGHHMVAGTVLGGALPGIHRLFSPREGYDVNIRPTLRDLGSTWVMATTFMGALVFHLTLAMVDTWFARLIGSALLPAITSAMWTTLCCLLLHLLVVPNRSKPS